MDNKSGGGHKGDGRLMRKIYRGSEVAISEVYRLYALMKSLRSLLSELLVASVLQGSDPFKCLQKTQILAKLSP